MQQLPAAQHTAAEMVQAREEANTEEAKQATAPGEEAARRLAPWDPEPAAPHSQAEQLNHNQLIQIREQMRRAGLGMAALEEWINRLRDISAIIEQGCRLNGSSGTGELLLDMVSDLVQDICSNGASPGLQAVER